MYYNSAVALMSDVSYQISDAASDPTYIQSVEMVADRWRLLLLQVFAYWSVRYMSVCVLTEASVDISHRLVHGHVYETSAQTVMGEDEQHGL